MSTRTVLRVVMTLGVAGVFGHSAGRSAQAAESFDVDTTHSTVFFRVKHMGVSYSYARFNEVTGGFTIDDAGTGKSSFNIEIKGESLDSGSANRRPSPLRSVPAPTGLALKDMVWIRGKV